MSFSTQSDDPVDNNNRIDAAPTDPVSPTGEGSGELQMLTIVDGPTNGGSSAPLSPVNASHSNTALETKSPAELKLVQQQMEEKVYQIWTVLSAFEESSAGCISEMLLHVSNGAYYDGVQMAGRFILHVDILFSAIDDLEAQMKEVGDQSGKQVLANKQTTTTTNETRGLILSTRDVMWSGVVVEMQHRLTDQQLFPLFFLPFLPSFFSNL